MKRWLLIAFLGSTLWAQGAGYIYARKITVSNTLAIGTNANFPMLYVGGSYLATVANGGRLQNVSGYDHIFSSTSNCSTPLNYETETGSYVATTGLIYDWIQITSLVPGSVAYVCYGNGAISTYQGNTNGTWDSTFAAVYHVPTNYDTNNCTNAGFITDSTANNNGASCFGIGQTFPIAGQIDEAIRFSGLNTIGSALYAPNASSLQITSQITLSGWFYLTAYNVTHTLLFTKDLVSYPPADYLFKVSGLGIDGINGKLGFIGGSSGWILGNTIVGLNSWYYLAVTVNETLGGSNELTFYINGVSDGNGTPAYNGTMTPATEELVMANEGGIGGGSDGLTGNADELRISNVPRTSAWILTEYNSQTQPCGSGAFCSIGSEMGGIVATPRHQGAIF